MKILFFKAGAIGDTIMTTPLVRQMRINFPDAKIDYLIGNNASKVLEGNPNISEIISFDENIFFKKNIFGILKLSREMARRKYDFIIVLDKHWVFGLVSLLFGIKQRIGFDRLGKEGIFLTRKVYYGNEKHEIFYYLDILKAIGCKTDYDDWKTEIFIDKKDTGFSNRVLQKLKGIKRIIGISPGGGKNAGEETEIRNFPAEKYAELIEKLLGRKGYFLILTGGKQDIEKENEIMDKLAPFYRKKVKSFIGKTSIGQTAALIKKCDYFICNDTGAMHIASAVNKHVISIFGPTKPERKAPLWKESHAIWKDKDIYEANYELYGKKPAREKKFFAKIKTDEIIRFIR